MVNISGLIIVAIIFFNQESQCVPFYILYLPLCNDSNTPFNLPFLVRISFLQPTIVTMYRVSLQPLVWSGHVYLEFTQYVHLLFLQCEIHCNVDGLLKLSNFEINFATYTELWRHFGTVFNSIIDLAVTRVVKHRQNSFL